MSYKLFKRWFIRKDKHHSNPKKTRIQQRTSDQSAVSNIHKFLFFRFRNETETILSQEIQKRKTLETQNQSLTHQLTQARKEQEWMVKSYQDRISLREGLERTIEIGVGRIRELEKSEL